MSELYSKAQIIELERIAIEDYAIAASELMERAGQAVLGHLQQHWPDAKRVLVFCGKGNNAGDGYVLARLAAQCGLKVIVYQLAELDQLSGAAHAAAQQCQQVEVEIQPFSGELSITADVIVDALLGTGINGPSKSPYDVAITAINAAKTPVLAIDVPSGLNIDTGSAQGEVVQADVTVTFIGLKQGLFTGQGRACAGRVYGDDLGVPVDAYAKVPSAAQTIKPMRLKPRCGDVHKGDCGHVLVIGGNYGMPGAARMAAEAAGRVGTGLVSVATRAQHLDAIVVGRPEIMCHAVDDPQDLKPLLAKATEIVIGPGLGQDEWAAQLFNLSMQASAHKVVDADALNLLAKTGGDPNDCIFTPHPGEAGRLLDCSAAEIQADRFAAVHKLQERYGGVFVLKGAGSLVYGFKRRIAVCAAGNPGMASGGMGDILSGVIGGILAQGLSLECAAKLGVYLHAAAADLVAAASGERGMLATDLLPYLQQLVNQK